MLAAAALLATPAMAADVVAYTVEAPFEDVAFDLKLAIENRGFVIDSTSHVGDMLNRTAADVGATRTLFTKADVLQFCSATVSRKAMEADIMNIAQCPYGIFAFETPDRPGVVTVGYRAMPEGAMKEVEAILDAIAREAAGQ
jgi:uncharacterized protein (DUF302 family)